MHANGDRSFHVYRRLLDFLGEEGDPSDGSLPIPRDRKDWDSLVEQLDGVPDNGGVFYNCFAKGECGDGFDLVYHGKTYGLARGAMFQEFTYVVCFDDLVFHVTHFYEHDYITRWPIEDVLQLLKAGESGDGTTTAKKESDVVDDEEAAWIQIANNGSGTLSHAWIHQSYFEDWSRCFLQAGYQPLKMLEHSGENSVWSVVKLEGNFQDDGVGDDDDNGDEQDVASEEALQTQAKVIKILYKHGDREPKVARQLVESPQPHLVSIEGVTRIGGCDAVIMEHYDGDLCDFHSWCKEECQPGQLLSGWLTMTAHITAAIHELYHNLGYVHFDIKPKNILFKKHLKFTDTEEEDQKGQNQYEYSFALCDFEGACRPTTTEQREAWLQDEFFVECPNLLPLWDHWWEPYKYHESRLPENYKELDPGRIDFGSLAIMLHPLKGIPVFDNIIGLLETHANDTKTTLAQVMLEIDGYLATGT